jgi:hypothetical protein
LCVGLVGPAAANAESLITASEAALPAAAAAAAPTKIATRGITRRPEAEAVPPKPGEPVKSPMTFRVKFIAHGGATVDPASVKVTYLKEPAVDLTPRLAKYISAAGIDMPDAELPPGEHLIRVQLRDSHGAPGSDVVTLTIGR